MVCLCSLADPGAVRLSAEHSEYRWLSAGEAFQLLDGSDPSTRWMRRVLQRAEQAAGLPGREHLVGTVGLRGAEVVVEDLLQDGPGDLGPF